MRLGETSHGSGYFEGEFRVSVEGTEACSERPGRLRFDSIRRTHYFAMTYSTTH